MKKRQMIIRDHDFPRQYMQFNWYPDEELPLAIWLNTGGSVEASKAKARSLGKWLLKVTAPSGVKGEK